MRVVMSCLLLVCLAGMVMWAALPSMESEADDAPKAKCEKKTILKLGKEAPIVLELKDLADGESKTYQNGDRTVVITRKGDRLMVAVDGKEIETAGLDWDDADGNAHVFVCGEGDGKDGQKMIFITEDAEKQDGKDGTHKIVIRRQKGDGPGDETEVKTVRVVTEDGKVFVTGEGGEGLVEIEDLKEGETRIVTKDGKTFTVTRGGDGVKVIRKGEDTFTVKVEGEDGDKEHQMVWVSKEGQAGEAGELEKEVMVLLFQNDGDTDHVKIECQTGTGEEREVTIKINDETHRITLGDLADGGSKTFTAGAHSIVVTRRGDQLELTLDGKPMRK